MSYTFIQPRRPQDFNVKQITAALKKGPVYSAPKRDGVRLQLIITPHAQAFLRSREDKPFRGMQMLEDKLNASWLQDYRVDLAGWTFEFEMEAIDHGTGYRLPAARTSGILNRSEQVLPGRLWWSLFDAHNETTRKLDIEQRQQALLDIADSLRSFVLQVAQYERLSYRIVHDLDGIESHYLGVRFMGMEGTVITPLGVPYAHGKKVASGWKRKPSMTKDGKAIGFNEAIAEDGTPKGTLGSIEVEYEDGTTGTASAGALTADERLVIWRNQADYLGRLLETKAMEENESGTLRHPTFLMWRDDIAAKGVKQ